MESHAINLQDKIQKLIDQYTEGKAKLAAAEEQLETLGMENLELIAQIDTINQHQTALQEKNRQLEEQLRAMEAKYNELQSTVTGFESIATDAISKIDSIFPDLDEDN